MTHVIYIKPRKRPLEDRKKIPPQPPKEVTVELLREFSYWLDNSVPGDKFCYYQGPHATGNSIAHAAYRAYEHGLVNLFQRREGKNFSYWAQRKKEDRY